MASSSVCLCTCSNCHLDYFNLFVTRLLASTLISLQSILQAATQVILLKSQSDYVIALLCLLQSLPAILKIQSKVLMAYKS